MCTVEVCHNNHDSMRTVELVFDGDFRVGIRTAIHFGAVGEEERAIGLRMCRSQHH